MHPVLAATAAGATAALVAAAAPARAADPFLDLLTAADRGRMEMFEQVRATALEEALTKGEAADRREAEKMLEGAPMPLTAATVKRRWRCRTIKLGAQSDLLPLVVYADFQCRIVEGADGLRFEKVTGSQRTAGRLIPWGTHRFGYAGSAWYGYEKGPKVYGADGERDEVGVLFQVGRDRLRLELPSPRLESKFDVIELRRP